MTAEEARVVVPISSETRHKKKNESRDAPPGKKTFLEREDLEKVTPRLAVRLGFVFIARFLFPGG